MKRIIFAILAVLVIGLVYRGVNASIERSKATVKTIEDYQSESGIPVVTGKADIRTIRAILGYTGTIKGIMQADVAATVSVERVMNIPVKAGDRVSKGDVLVELDDQVTAEKRMARESLEDAQREYKRVQALLDAGAVSQQLLDKAGLALSVAQAQVDAASWRHTAASPIDGGGD